MCFVLLNVSLLVWTKVRLTAVGSVGLCHGAQCELYASKHELQSVLQTDSSVSHFLLEATKWKVLVFTRGWDRGRESRSGDRQRDEQRSRGDTRRGPASGGCGQRFVKHIFLFFYPEFNSFENVSTKHHIAKVWKTLKQTQLSVINECCWWRSAVVIHV